MSIEACKEIIREAKRIVFFGGAGVSTDSGIPDFRGNGGLYGEETYFGEHMHNLQEHISQLAERKLLSMYPRRKNYNQDLCQVLR